MNIVSVYRSLGFNCNLPMVLWAEGGAGISHCAWACIALRFAVLAKVSSTHTYTHTLAQHPQAAKTQWRQRRWWWRRPSLTTTTTTTRKCEVRVAVKLIIISAESKIKCKQLKWAWMDSTMRRAVGEFAIPNTGDGATSTEAAEVAATATATATSFSTHSAGSNSNSISSSNNTPAAATITTPTTTITTTRTAATTECDIEARNGQPSTPTQSVAERVEGLERGVRVRGGLVCKTSERSQTICVEWRPLASGAVFVFAHHYFQHAHAHTHIHSQSPTHRQRKVDTFASKCFNCSLPKWHTHTHTHAGTRTLAQAIN